MLAVGIEEGFEEGGAVVEVLRPRDRVWPETEADDFLDGFLGHERQGSTNVLRSQGTNLQVCKTVVSLSIFKEKQPMPNFRFDPKRNPPMVRVTTSPTEDETMLRVRVEDDKGNCVLAVEATPNLVKGAGVPIDVSDPTSWNAEVRIGLPEMMQMAQGLSGSRLKN